MRTYFVTVGLEAGLTLLCALPFVLLALWRSRTRSWPLVALVGALVVVQDAIGELPRATAFLQRLHWSWQATLLTAALPLLVARGIPRLSLATMGITSGLRPGWFRPSLAALRGIAPFMLGLVSGWVRERTGSVWPSVLGHNLSNIVIPVLTLASRATP